MRIQHVVSVVVLSALHACVLNNVVATGTVPTGQQGHAPIISSFTANPSNQVAIGQPLTFLAVASDADGDSLQFNWSATGGTLSTNTGQVVSWLPPTSPGVYTVQVIVTDGRGGAVTGSQNLTVAAGRATLEPPVISNPTPATDVGAGKETGLTKPPTTAMSGEGRWVVQQSGVSETLRALWFTDAMTGIIVGDNGVMLKTSTAGADWTRIRSMAVSNDPLTDITFSDATHAWCVSSKGRICRSDDAGATWQIAYKAEGALQGIRFTSPSTGYAVGAVVLVTVDGGVTWTEQKTAMWGSPAFVETGGEAVWVGGIGSNLAKFTPGLGWEQQAIWRDRAGAGPVAIQGASFSTPKLGWAFAPVDGQWFLSKTSDGGVTWHVASPKTVRGDEILLARVYAIDFDEPGVGWVIANAVGGAPEGAIEEEPGTAMLLTRDEGQTWSRAKTGPLVAGAVEAFEMVDSQTGWAAGGRGQIWRYVAGPQTSEQAQSVPQSDEWNGSK